MRLVRSVKNNILEFCPFVASASHQGLGRRIGTREEGRMMGIREDRERKRCEKQQSHNCTYYYSMQKN